MKLPEDRARAIFKMDKKQLFKTDIFFYVLDGRIPDEGAAVALGMSYIYKELVNGNLLLVGLHTDKRVAFTNGKLNPMIFSSLDYIADSIEELMTYLKTVSK
jgi:hypothetical protein